MIVESWVLWTILASFMQAVRTAGQKQLTTNVTPLAATLARYLYGVPFVLVWLWFTSDGQLSALPDLNLNFLVSGLIAGVLQILATLLLIRLLGLRNFAVGSTYVKTEILLTAILGFTFFAEQITLMGFAAIVICVVGLILISVSKSGGLASLWNQSAIYGLAAGLCFSLTSLFLRRASLSFGIDDAMFTASITLAYMVTLQCCITFFWVRLQQPGQITKLLKLWKPGFFIGVTSVAGSIGWFTAMTLEFASYVKTLGQLEFLFTLAISILYFRERPTPMEFMGMGLIIFGAVILLLT